ncbi:Hypothetical protein D9617_17g046860 [Elsinoe fawcettii]|nr:Hypothetical protein D9617_17g046860 [Elsinoe fawcettii]
MPRTISPQLFFFLQHYAAVYFGIFISAMVIWEETATNNPSARRRWQHNSSGICFHCGRRRCYTNGMARHLRDCLGSTNRRGGNDSWANTSFDLQWFQWQNASSRYDEPSHSIWSGPWHLSPNPTETSPAMPPYISSHWGPATGMAVAPALQYPGGTSQQSPPTFDTSSFLPSDAPAQPAAGGIDFSTRDELFDFNHFRSHAPNEDGSQYLVNPANNVNIVTPSMTDYEIGSDFDYYGSLNGMVQSEYETDQNGHRMNGNGGDVDRNI